jgi:hypothetical protein
MKTFKECAERIEHLETGPAMALIFEWVKTGVINKSTFTGLVRIATKTNEPTAYGSGDGNWVRAQDLELRPDRERFKIKFYGELG